MTKESLAKQLDGREYGSEITTDECAMAKQCGLLIVFGYSDDNVEFRGAFEGEVGAYESGVIPFTTTGPLSEHDDGCECDFCGYKEAVKKAHILGFEFKSEGWKFSTKLPHAKFTIKEGGGIFGEGLVIELPK
jgi:hypothetical protein